MATEYVNGITSKGIILEIPVEDGTCVCSGFDLVTIQIPNPEMIKKLYCSNNQLTSLPDGMVNLESLFCSGNPDLVIPEYLKHLVK